MSYPREWPGMRYYGHDYEAVEIVQFYPDGKQLGIVLRDPTTQQFGNYTIDRLHMLKPLTPAGRAMLKLALRV